jgi:hypothetical protein
VEQSTAERRGFDTVSNKGVKSCQGPGNPSARCDSVDISGPITATTTVATIGLDRLVAFDWEITH